MKHPERKHRVRNRRRATAGAGRSIRVRPFSVASVHSCSDQQPPPGMAPQHEPHHALTPCRATLNLVYIG